MANKRNPQGAGGIRQRADGTWEARYTTGRDPGTGKQIRKSVYGKTQKEVRQKLTQATAALDEGTYKEPSKMTLGQWMDIWVDDYLVDVKPLTVSSYTDHIRNHIKPALGAVRLEELTTHNIQNMYNKIGKGKDDKPPLSPKTIKNIHGVLHRILKQAVEVGYLRFNPSDACKWPKVIKKEITPLDEEQSKAFLQAIVGHRFQTLYTVTLFTGMREGEVMGLTWDCVDFDNGMIKIEKQLQQQRQKGSQYVFAPLKNDKVRLITPAPWVMKMLHAHWVTQAKERLRLGEVWENWENAELVFTNEVGRHLARVTIIKDFKKIAASIGRPDLRFHDLRHSYAVASIRSGDDIKTVQGNLGHATASFTLDVYGHVTDQMKQASSQRMESYIKDVLNLG